MAFLKAVWSSIAGVPVPPAPMKQIHTITPDIPSWNESSQVFNTVHYNDWTPVHLISPDMKTGPWIAGGAVLHWYQHTPIGQSDIDVFCKDDKQAQKLVKQFKGYNCCHVAYESDNATTFKFFTVKEPIRSWTIQIIVKNYFNSPEEIIERFDISACKLVTDGYSYILGENTAADIRTKTLRMDYPIRSDSPKRFVKYIAYGYRPVEGLYNNIVNNSEIDWNFTQESDYNGI